MLLCCPPPPGMPVCAGVGDWDVLVGQYVHASTGEELTKYLYDVGVSARIEHIGIIQLQEVPIFLYICIEKE